MTLVKNICSLILSGCCVLLEDLLLSVSEFWSHSRVEGLNVARSQELITGEPPNSGLIFWAPHLLCYSNCFDFYGRFLTREKLFLHTACQSVAFRSIWWHFGQRKTQGRGFYWSSIRILFVINENFQQKLMAVNEIRIVVYKYSVEWCEIYMK